MSYQGAQEGFKKMYPLNNRLQFILNFIIGVGPTCLPIFSALLNNKNMA